MIIGRRQLISTIKIVSNYSFASSVSKRSYYDILQLKPQFSQKELRKHFLQKARIYHPDYNQSAEAAQEFKLLKQAYETLKDPQKKHMYDSGIGQTSEEVAPVHNQQVKIGKRYYENKWYGYKKPKNEDMRDEYYKAKAQFFQQKPTNPFKYVIPFTIITLALFGYDILSNLDSDKSRKIDAAKTVIENSISSNQKQTKQQILLRRYLERRAQANKVDL